MNKAKKFMSLFLIAILAMSMTMTACSKSTDNDKLTESDGNTTNEDGIFDGSGNASKLVLTVGDSKVYLDEIMYYVLYIESEYDYYDQMYQMMGNGSVWDDEREGKTGREAAKDEVLQAAEMYEILSSEAAKAGMALTDEDKAEFDSNADAFMQSISEDQKKVTGLTKELMIKLYEKLTLSDKYYESLIEGFGITKDQFKDTVKEADFRQYNTESIFVSTKKTDEEGNNVEVTEKETKAAKKAIDAVLEKAKSGEEFAKVVEGDETLVNATNDFVAGEGTVSEAYEKAAKKLKNGEVSDVIKTDEGYYIIKMNDNDSKDRYEQELQNAVNAKQSELFTAKFEELKAGYTIEVNNEVWDLITMGNMTLIPEAEAPAEGEETPAEGEETPAEGEEVPAENDENAAEDGNQEAPADADKPSE